MVITIDDLSHVSTIPIGKQGENNAVQVRFNLATMISEYGSGTARIILQRPGDTEPYVVQRVTQVNDIAVWTVTSADTAKAGTGYAELRWVVGGNLAKSVLFPVEISTGLIGSAEAPGSTVYMASGLTDIIRNLSTLRLVRASDGTYSLSGNAINMSSFTTSDASTTGAWIYNILAGPMRINVGRTVNVTIPAGSDYVDVDITFASEFGEAPYIQLTGRSTTTNINNVPIPVINGSTTTTGATIRVWRNGTNNSAAAYPTVWWLAIGKA